MQHYLLQIPCYSTGPVLSVGMDSTNLMGSGVRLSGWCMEHTERERLEVQPDAKSVSV